MGMEGAATRAGSFTGFSGSVHAADWIGPSVFGVGWFRALLL